MCFILPMNSRRVWTSLSQRSKTVLRAPILLKPYKRTRQNLTEIVGDGGGGGGGRAGVWEGSLASTELNWRFPLHYDVFSFFLIFVYA